jgi:sugar phosphate isomerase/epimerase
MKLAALGLAAAAGSRAAKPKWTVKQEGDPFAGLKIGLTSYSTRELRLDQTIDLLNKLAIPNLSLKYFHLPLKSTREQRESVRTKVADAGLKRRGCGVVGLPDEEFNMRRRLDYVRDLGVDVVTVTIPREGLATLNRAIKDYEFKVAIHTHGPEDQLRYWRWDARLIMRMIAGLDPKIGVCVDVGHTFRMPLDPVEAIEACGDRLYDVHLKDLQEASRRRLDVPLGRGVIDIPRVLRTLRERNYRHHVALEYEADPRTPELGIAESFGYLRGVLSAPSAG